MSSILFFILCQLSVIACGVVSGVFLTFSDFVMLSLDRARTAAGVEVMQVINREVYNSVFMFLLIGISALSPFLMGYAYFRIDGFASVLIMMGGLTYLAGVFAVSLIFNVPMNKQLDRWEYSDHEAATYWSNTYMTRWTYWNHVRAIASAVSAICYLVAGVLLT